MRSLALLIGRALLRSVTGFCAIARPSSRLSFRQSTSEEDLLLSQEGFCKFAGVRFPLDYLRASRSFLARNVAGVPVGGFTLVRGTASRTLMQIPPAARDRILAELGGVELVEITGVWLEHQKHGLASAISYWIKIWEEAFCTLPSCVSVYGCDTRKPGLMKVYRLAGRQVYCGPLLELPGMEDGAHEEAVYVGTWQEFFSCICREVARRLVRPWRTKSRT